MRRTIMTAALISGFALSTTAVADPGPRGPGPGRSPFMHELKELDLSADQKSQIKALFETQREQHRALPESDGLHELRRSFDRATPGSPEYNSLAAQLADREATQAREQVQQMAEMRTQVYGLLTVAQRKQLATNLAQAPEPPPPRD